VYKTKSKGCPIQEQPLLLENRNFLHRMNFAYCPAIPALIEITRTEFVLTDPEGLARLSKQS
jgi:hypothetical protein